MDINIDPTTLTTGGIMSNPWIGVAALAAGGLIHTLIQANNQDTKSQTPLPPSPKGELPFFGHLLMLDRLSVHTTFAKWAKELKSPIISVKMGPDTWIVLSSPKAVRDLFDQRGSNYSDRTLNPIINALTLNGNIAPFSHDNDHWRLMRRLANNALCKQRLASYAKHFDRESLCVLRTLFASSSNPAGIVHADAIDLYVLNIMNSILFSKRCETMNDPFAKEIVKIAREFVIIGSNGVINLFPHFEPMNWGMIRHAKQIQEKVRKIWGEGLVKEVVEARERGEEIECVANDLLKIEDDDKLPYESIVQNLFGFTMAGTDTSDSAIQNLINVLTNHPEVQDKAYAEIISVVGVDRLPDSNDESDLPYLKAVIKETLRYRPPVLMGLPHRTIEEDFYEGYRIPAKTTVIANNYAIHFNPEYYEDPFTFKPERFLSETTAIPSSKRDHFTFGAGRRICPGMVMAEKTTFTLISRLLWAFKFQAPLDENGNEVPVELMNTDCEFFCLAPRTNLRFLPRHPNVANLLASD